MNGYYKWYPWQSIYHRLFKRQQRGLIISEAGAGKTSLLDPAGLIPFDYSQADLLLNDQPKNTLTRWRYNAADCLSITLPKDGHMPKTLMDHLTKANTQRITFVLLCLDASQIKTHCMPSLVSILRQLNKQAKRSIPLYIVLTKSDKIHGFEAYSHHLSEACRGDIWGMQFAQMPTADTWLKASSQFLKTIQRHCLSKLHVTHLQTRREALIGFPLTLADTLKQTYQCLATQLQTHSLLTLKGFYLTSNAPNTPSFFTANIMPHILSSVSAPGTTPKAKRCNAPKHVWTTGTAALALVLGLAMTVSYYRLVTATQQQVTTLLNTTLAFTPEQPVSKKVYYDMSSMATLKQWQQALAPVLHAHRMVFPLTSLKRLTHHLREKQEAMLYTVFEPYLDHYIVNSLKTLDTQHTWQHAQKRYHYLQAYFLLHSPNRLAHRTQLHRVFNQDQHPPKLASYYLDQLLSLVPKPASPEIAAAISKAQQTLRLYPASTLIATLAINAIQEASQVIATHQVNLYTLPNAKAFETQLTQSARHVAQGKDPVIGQAMPIQSTDLSQAKLHYFKAYRHYWEKQLRLQTVDAMAPLLTAVNPSQKNPESTLKTAANLLKTLLDEHDPTYQQLVKINQHVAYQPNWPEFNQEVSHHFTGLSVFLADLKAHKSTYQTLQKAYHYLISSDYKPETALAMAKKHMMRQHDPLTQLRYQAQPLTPPLRDWLNDIETLAFKGLLALSREAMNKAWKTSVWQPYQSQLAGRYPLFKGSHHDVTLKAFTRFFGPHGHLHQFYLHYMQPFIDRKEFYWVWKDVDGNHLPIPQTVLELFMRGQLIRNMYFPQGKSYPEAHFIITPSGLTPAVHQLRLMINDQQVTYSSQDIPKPLSFSWPDLNHPDINLVLSDNADNVIKLAQTGLWAWFKLLDKGILKPTDDLTHYTLQISAKGLSTRYAITTDRKLNPLALDIISGFRCPKSL